MIEGIENLKINNKKLIEPYVLTSVKVSSEFYQLSKANNISFAEAMRVGISILLAEAGLKEYDNRLNIYRKMIHYQKLAEEALLKKNEMEERLKTIEKRNNAI